MPGDSFPRGTADQLPGDLYDSVLSGVVDLGYQYLRQVVRLTQMVGYLWWSNSYYLTALEAEDRIRIPQPDLMERKSRYYPSRTRSPIEETSQIQRVLDTRIIQREGRDITGDPDLTPRYLEEARSAGLAFAG